METITLFLCAAGLVALFLAIFGNTRPLGGLVAAFVVGGLCFAWVLSLRSIHMGATIFILAIVFGLPLSAFLGYMACAALAGWSTTRLGRGPRAFFALIALACLGGALAPYVLEEMEERQRENTAAQTARESFPPAYRDLCAPVAAPEAFDKEA